VKVEEEGEGEEEQREEKGGEGRRGGEGKEGGRRRKKEQEEDVTFTRAENIFFYSLWERFSGWRSGEQIIVETACGST
jgi:hypothetical protein